MLQVDSSGCNPSLTKLAEDAFGACNKANEFALQVMRERQPKVVIIAQGPIMKAQILQKMAKYIKSLGVKQVILLGPIPQWNDDLYSIYAKNYWDAAPKG